MFTLLKVLFAAFLAAGGHVKATADTGQEPSKPYWDCSDGDMIRTYDECNREGSKLVNKGCWYDKDMGLFLSCQDSCHSMLVGSTEEERCSRNCPGYLDTCEQVKPAPLPSSTTTDQTQQHNVIVAVSVFSSVVCVPAIVFLLLLVIRKKSRLCPWCQEFDCRLCLFLRNWLPLWFVPVRQIIPKNSSDSMDDSSSVGSRPETVSDNDSFHGFDV